MLYIVIALKSEAQAFVDKYKLSKSKIGDFSVFSNSQIMLIISGLGVMNSTRATQTLINHYDITDDDIYLNVGICGASEAYSIGELIQIGEIHYQHHKVTLENDGKTIRCLDEEVTQNLGEIVDMESYGFYDAVIHSPAIKNFYILKVVSDHFEPHKVTKDATKSLVFNVIDDINIIIKKEETT